MSQVLIELSSRDLLILSEIGQKDSDNFYVCTPLSMGFRLTTDTLALSRGRANTNPHSGLSTHDFMHCTQ